MNTRSQTFAEKIFRQVTAVKSKDDEFKEKYVGMAHKLPILIRTAGLVQALAFVQSREEEGSDQLLEDIGKTIGRENLLKLSREAELSAYRELTRDTLDALIWYKRFSQSILDSE